MLKSRIMYLENKQTGEAFIGRVKFSRTGQTVYYRDIVLSRIGGQRSRQGENRGNFYDTGSVWPDIHEWWVSGPKKNGQDSLHGAKVKLRIDKDIADEYWTTIRGRKKSKCLVKV